MKKTDPEAGKKPEPKTKDEQDRKLSEELDESFPASDPPASVQPGSGATGPEVVRK